MGNCWDALAILMAILVPPIGVFMKVECRCEFWISILLTFLGYIPGIVYAIYVIAKEAHREQDYVVYYQQP